MASGYYLALYLLLLLLAVSAADERANGSSPAGIVWAAVKDESDLVDAANTIEDEDDELAGGFSSLEGMLQWAIGHSDPTMLKEKANDVQGLSANELKTRQLELKELMEKLQVPSDAELMKISVDNLNNSSLSFEDRLRALNELLILVESIDNANDLDKLGGLVTVVGELSSLEPEIRMISAWILGKAGQNNLLVQNQILALGALTRLTKMVKSHDTEEALKALYAISGLIRNNDNAQDLFYSEDGSLLLQEILSNSSFDVRLHKKAVFLVADLLDRQLENGNGVLSAKFSSRLFLKSVVGLTSSTDLDLEEKALLVIRSLLQLKSTEIVSDLDDYCDLDMALERMRDKLEQFTDDDDENDFARDVERLREEVYNIFHWKLEKVAMHDFMLNVTSTVFGISRL